MLQEWHYFFQNTRRWRNLRKITIAQVHGAVYAAGLMLMWACDLIVAAEDTIFADVVGTRLGMCGVEYFAHPWEFGPRKTKELMLTGDSIDADEAYRARHGEQGLPRRRAGRAHARASPGASPSCRPWPRCSSRSRSTRRMDNMGFYNALNACFTLHELNHAHWAERPRGRLAPGPPRGRHRGLARRAEGAQQATVRAVTGRRGPATGAGAAPTISRRSGRRARSCRRACRRSPG